MSVDIDNLISKFIELRDGLERLEAEAKAKKAPLVQAQETIANYLLKLANEQNTNSFKTASGTAFKQSVTRASVTDPAALQKHVQDTGDFHLLPKAVNKTAVQDYINIHEKPPPGVGWTVLTEIQVRRS